MKFKYRHKDGRGCVYSGLSADALSKKDFVAEVLGPLERDVETSEQINAATGAIEPRPKTEQETKREALKTKLRAGTASPQEVQKALADLV